MGAKKAKFMIIDGNALIHRSFHALPPLTTKTGEIVNAVYGFTAVLIKALREFKPTYVALTLDRKEKTFRHDQFNGYKATRVKAPDELYAQIPRVKEIAENFNIPIFELAGFEADDLIGTLANRVDGAVEKIIVTGDMDTMQLINDHTKVFTMKRGLTDSVIYDEKAVRERYGLEPGQMIDFKALRGDPSDNIPGVKGIGEKTATELLKNFKTLDGVYKNINSKKIKDRIRELLAQHKNDAYMSRSLATIKCDAPIEFDLGGARFGQFDQGKLAKLFNELEFRSLLPRLQGLAEEAEKRLIKDKNYEQTDKFKRNLELFKYELIDNDKKFDKFFKKLQTQKEFAFDTETANFNPVTAELLGISFSWKSGEAYYLETKNKKLKVKSNLFNYNKNDNQEDNLWLEKLRPIFKNEKIKKYGHNIKYDIEVMASLGIDVKGVAADSMIASYLLNPGSRQHNLDAVTFNEFNHQKITKEDLLGKGKEKISFGEVAVEKLYNYSCEDADFTNRLAKKLLSELKKQKLIKLFDEIEMPLVLVLAEMETNGIKIDKEFLADMGKAVDKKISHLRKKIHDLAGLEFNINSTQQLRDVLFEKLAIPAAGISKNKTGLSTGADELFKLKGQHPIIDLIQEYREVVKLSTTYIEALPKLVNQKTGRLHTSFNQTVTATGRLSSTEPNMQNIPIRTDLGREIRKAFIAGKGYKLLSLDYSQIELRLAAHMSGDKKMIEAFKKGEDIHTATAAEINQISLTEVTPELRREAKAVNFGILYGQGPHGLSQGADIPYVRAKEFIDKYFLAYKGVKKFVDQTIEMARNKGYTETLFQRRRILPEINSSVMQVRKGAERMAINTPLQGTAADIIKVAMIRIKKLIDQNYQAGEIKMLLQVHDELVFEVKEDLAEKTAVEIKNIMESVIKLKVPLGVDASLGDNWGEMGRI
ncbi:DNA polymerase I [Candidatus Falkowbacteria bacterium]|nr:DNA polymerase I [Candidatus Falkowbacteria bacterium]